MNTAHGSQLTPDNTLNAIADDIVGASDMTVVVENDPVEWAALAGPDSEDVLGFVSVEAPPTSLLYHAIFLSPFTASAWTAWEASGSPAGNENNFAISAMTLIHESFHWQLNSTDENTVEACALKWFPYYIVKDFNVPATITQTTTQEVPKKTVERVPVKKMVKKTERVRVGGRWVTRTVRKPVTTYVKKTVKTYVGTTVMTTVPNPIYQTLVADAQTFYNGQSSDYNTGTCPTSPPTTAPTPTPPVLPAASYHVKACWEQYTGGAWSAVDQSDATTSFASSDITARGATNFWAVVALDAPPTAPFTGTAVTLIEPNGTTFFTEPLADPWSTADSRWETAFDWTWNSDHSPFFAHPERSGTGSWTFTWTFPDGETCSSSFTVS